MADEEVKGPSKPERKLSAGKIVVGLTALATIVGGVAAGFQIYDYYNRPDPAPTKEKAVKAETLPEGWRRETLEGGISVAMPSTWKPVERDAVIALMRGTDDFSVESFLRVLGPDDSFNFVIEETGVPNAPTVFAAFGDLKAAPDQNLEKTVADMRQRRDVRTASLVELPQGEAAHVIMERWMQNSNGYETAILMDIYIIPKYGRLWMGILYMSENEHLPYSGTFRKIVETLKAPIPEPPPPGMDP